MSGSRTLLPHLTGLTSAAGKDLDREAALAALNDLLAPLERDLEAGLSAPIYSPIFILGAPRSGTTLTSQLLAATGLFGIVSNFAARFWKAPALGLRIVRATGLCDAAASSLRSDHGLTEGWCEPNEFGYFWSRFFDLGQPTHQLGAAERARFDRAGLRRAVAAMEREAGRPMALKNNTWLTLNADLVAEVFPGCVLVACERDPYFVAQSMLRQRERLHGDRSAWWSVRPAEYEAIRKLDPIEQVAAQAVAIQAGMQASLSAASRGRILRLPYNRTVAAPRDVAAEVAAAAGHSADAVEAVLARLPVSLDSTDRDMLDAGTGRLLRRHVEEHLRHRAAPPTG